MKHILPSLALIVCSATTVVLAQQEERPSVINIKVSRTVKSVSYQMRGGETRIDFQGTALLPRAEGKAKVESKQGRIEIEAEFSRLEPATQFGSAYLTYVLWAITPEGRASNLGEVLLRGTNSKLNVTTRLQAFAMIVTAEPYFAVTFPSESVVLENIIRSDTLGKVDVVDAKFELFQRGNYEGAQLTPFQIEPKTPLELYEARNALRIAKWQQADVYAVESFAKAQAALENAESYQIRKGDHRKPTAMSAREAVQLAEDARVIAVKRVAEEQLAEERRVAEARRAKAQADSEAEARRRAEAEEESKRAEAARAAAEKSKIEAELAAARAAQAKAEADAANLAAQAREQQAQAEAEAARKAAEAAEAAAKDAEQKRQQLRAQLLEQFNRILETRDTPRGLVARMADVLFESGKYSLRPTTRETLARFSGILLAHPGLKLEIEGHTDNVGGDSYNQRLSEKRAEAVRDYLLEQGLDAGSIVAKGFGESMPVESNDDAKGRQQNRRVEIIISGEVIGAKIGAHPNE